MSHLKAILFRRDRIWLAALVGAVGLVAIASYLFYFTKQQEVEAFVVADITNNAIANNVVALSESDVLALDITLPNPGSDTSILDVAGADAVATDVLTDFPANNRFADEALDGNFNGDEAIFLSADSSISNGEIVSGGLANMLSFFNDDVNVKFSDDNHDDAGDDYSGSELIVRSADSSILDAEIITAGTADLTAFDMAGAGIEVFADTTDDNTFDSLNDATTEDIYRQVHGTDGFITTTITSFAANEKFVDANHSGTYNDGEAIIDSADGNLTAGVLSGAGTDDIKTDGSADLVSFGATLYYYDNNSGGTYTDGEAIINDIDADGQLTAGDTLVTPGLAHVTALVGGDKIYFEDSDADTNFDFGEVIWHDNDGTGADFDDGTDFVIVGNFAPITFPAVALVSAGKGVAFLDADADAAYDAVNNLPGPGGAETLVYFGFGTSPATNDPLTGAVTYFDPADIMMNDDIAANWIDDLANFSASDRYCDTDDGADYDSGEAIVSSGDVNLDNDGDSVTTSGTCNLTAFPATMLFVGGGSYIDGNNIFSRIHDGTDVSGNGSEVRVMDANDKFSDADNSGVYTDGELIVRSADANVSNGEVLVSGTVDVTAFGATFRWSDEDNDTFYTNGELIAETFGTSLDAGEVVKEGLVSTIAFNSAASPYYTFFDNDTDGVYDTTEDVLTDDDNSGYYNADKVSSIIVGNAGTAADADIDDLIIYEDTNDNGVLDVGTDAVVVNVAAAPFIDAENAVTGSVYTTGDGEQRLFVTVNVAAGATDGRTFAFILEDNACVLDGDAGCAVKLASTNDGPTDATITSTDPGAGFGLIAIDGIAPTIVSAETTSDNDIIVTFSEIVASTGSGDLTTDGGEVSFTDISVDMGGGEGPSVFIWEDAESRWATDATGSAAGAGFDSLGGPAGIVPDLSMLAGAVTDVAGNPIVAVVANDMTTDGSAPIALSASYLDVTDVDGTIDRVDVVFSEDLAIVYNAADWAFSTPGDMNLDDTGASISGRTVQLDVVGDANETGGVAPHLQYTNNADRLTDLAVAPVAAGSFNTGAIDDAAAPVILARETTDVDENGQIDSIILTFSENMDDSTFAPGADGWNVEAPYVGEVINTGGDDGDEILEIAITESGASDTGVTPDVTFEEGTLADDAANLLVSNGPVASIDGAAPVIVTRVTRDNDSDGQIDGIFVTFSEDISDASLPPSPGGWAVADYDDEVVTTGFADDEILVVVFSESGEADTGAIPAVSFNNDMTADSAANQVPTTGAIASTDGADPVVMTRETRDGDEDGKIDAIDITFSEVIDEDTIGLGASSGWDVTGYDGETVATGDAEDDDAIRVVITEGVAGDTDAVPDVEYELAALSDEIGNSLAANGPTVSTDEAAPVVMTTSPDDGEDDVNDSANIVITFSEPMDTEGADAAFSIDADPDGAEVKGWSDSNKVLTVNPSSNLEKGDTYTVTIDGTAPSAALGDADLSITSFDFEVESRRSGGSSSGGGVTTTEPAITITSPTGSDEFDGGDEVTIDYAVTGSGVNSVKLYYSVDGGDHYTLIVSGLGNNDTYDWTVPNTDTDTAIIKAIAFDSGAATLDTDVTGAFSINLTSSLPEDDVETNDDAELMDRDSANDELPSGIEVDNLVRGTLPAVYYIGLDAKRHPFPNEQIYMTWFENFDNVDVISDADLADISLGTPVLTRPGTLMVKIVSDPKTYVVTPGYELRWVTSEEVAVALFGSTWNQRIMDIEPTYFSHFSFGDDITDATYPDGSLVMSADDDTVYYIDGSDRREVTADGMSENFFQSRFVSTSSDDSWMDFDLGSAINGLEDSLFSELLP